MPSARLNRTQVGLPLSVAAIRTWLLRAEPGERLQYHRGLLALDRVKGTSCLREAERRRLAAVADHASALAGQGKLHLLQERHGYADYSYWAIARVPSGSVVARVSLPATAAQDKFTSAGTADPQAGPPSHPERPMAAHVLEREEVA